MLSTSGFGPDLELPSMRVRRSSPRALTARNKRSLLFPSSKLLQGESYDNANNMGPTSRALRRHALRRKDRILLVVGMSTHEQMPTTW